MQVLLKVFVPLFLLLNEAHTNPLSQSRSEGLSRERDPGGWRRAEDDSDLPTKVMMSGTDSDGDPGSAEEDVPSLLQTEQHHPATSSARFSHSSTATSRLTRGLIRFPGGLRSPNGMRRGPSAQQTMYQVTEQRAFLVPDQHVSELSRITPLQGTLCDDQIFTTNNDGSRIPESITEADCTQSCSSCQGRGRVKPLLYNIEVLQKYLTSDGRQVYRREKKQLTLRCVCDTSGAPIEDAFSVIQAPPNPRVKETIYTIAKTQREGFPPPEETGYNAQLPTHSAQMCPETVNEEVREDDSNMPSLIYRAVCSASTCKTCTGNVVPIYFNIQLLKRVSSSGLYRQVTEQVTVGCACQQVRTVYRLTPYHANMSAVRVPIPAPQPTDIRGELCPDQVPVEGAISDTSIPDTLVEMDCQRSCLDCPRGRIRPIRHNIRILRKHPYRGGFVYVYENAQVTVACACDADTQVTHTVNPTEQPECTYTTLSSSELVYKVEGVHVGSRPDDSAGQAPLQTATRGQICTDGRPVWNWVDRVPISLITYDCQRSCQTCSGTRRPVMLNVPGALQRIPGSSLYEKTTLQLPVACVCEPRN